MVPVSQSHVLTWSKYFGMCWQYFVGVKASGSTTGCVKEWRDTRDTRDTKKKHVCGKHMSNYEVLGQVLRHVCQIQRINSTEVFISNKPGLNRTEYVNILVNPLQTVP